MDPEARSKDKQEVRAQRDVVRDDGADKVRVRVLFTVENDVGTQFADAKGSLSTLFPGHGGADAMRTLRLQARHCLAFSSVVPRGDEATAETPQAL